MGCRSLRDSYVDKCERVFSWYGKKVGKYPWAVITGCVIVNAALGCLLLIGIDSVNDVEEVYVPIGNQAAKDRYKAQNLFPDQSGTAFYPQHLTNDGKFGEVIVSALYGSSVLTEAVINETTRAIQTIKRFSFTGSNNSIVDFEKVCARRMGSCVVDGDFMQTDSFKDDLRSGQVSYPHYNLGNQSVDLSAYLGAVSHSNGTLLSAKYLKLRFTLRQDSTEFTYLSKKWEDIFLKEMKNIGGITTLTDISYAVSDSLNVELDANTDGDILWFSLTFTLMITYASIVTAGGNCVSTKGHLATAGVLAAGLGILSGFGIASRILPFTNIVGVMPFLVLGVGVDDTFVLISGWTTNRKADSIEERLAATMKTSGISITLTSATDVVAFLVGLTSTFQGVRIFCLYTALAILFCYVNQVTFFAACLAVHGKRVGDNRHCVTCRRVKTPNEMETEQLNQLAMSNFRIDLKHFHGLGNNLEVAVIIHEDDNEEDVQFNFTRGNSVSAKSTSEIVIVQQKIAPNTNGNVYSFHVSDDLAARASRVGSLSVCSSDGYVVTFIFTGTVAKDIGKKGYFWIATHTLIKVKTCTFKRQDTLIIGHKLYQDTRNRFFAGMVKEVRNDQALSNLLEEMNLRFNHNTEAREVSKTTFIIHDDEEDFEKEIQNRLETGKIAFGTHSIFDEVSHFRHSGLFLFSLSPLQASIISQTRTLLVRSSHNLNVRFVFTTKAARKIKETPLLCLATSSCALSTVKHKIPVGGSVRAPRLEEGDLQHCVTCINSRESETARQNVRDFLTFESEFKRRFHLVKNTTLILHDNEQENVKDIRGSLKRGNFFGTERNTTSVQSVNEIEVSVCGKSNGSGNVYRFDLSPERATVLSRTGTLSVCSGSFVVTFIFTPKVADDIEKSRIFVVKYPGDTLAITDPDTDTVAIEFDRSLGSVEEKEHIQPTVYYFERNNTANIPDKMAKGEQIESGMSYFLKDILSRAEAFDDRPTRDIKDSSVTSSSGVVLKKKEWKQQESSMAITLSIYDNELEVKPILKSQRRGTDRNKISSDSANEIEVFVCGKRDMMGTVYKFVLSNERALRLSQTQTLTITDSNHAQRTGIEVTFFFTPTVAANIKGLGEFFLKTSSEPHDWGTLCYNYLECEVVSGDPSHALDDIQFVCPLAPLQPLPYSGRLAARIYCCSGEPSKVEDDDGNCFQWGPRKFLPYVLNKVVKVVAIVLFLGYLVASIWGATLLEQGLDLKNLIAPSSYFYRYTNWNNDYFETRILISFFVNEPVAYSQASSRKDVDNLFRDIQNDKDMSSKFLISWISAYQSSIIYNQSNEQVFIAGLRKFVLYNPVFENDISFGNNYSEITASRFHFQSLNTPKSYDQGQLMIRMRDIATRSNLPVFAYSPPFIYFEQFNAILSNTLQTVGVAAAAMFVLALIFMPYPFVFISVAVAMVSTLVGVFGFIYWWDLTLSSVTMIHLVMSTGFSVDYCAHISHTVMQRPGEGGVKEALRVIGGPILNGAMSSFLGILFLLASESYIFRSFFKVMLLVILFGIAHSCCFLPVFFSLISKLRENRTTQRVVCPQN